MLAFASPAAGVELPPGFGATDAITGLHYPTAAAFAEDGRVFVTQKHGLVTVYDSLEDETPATVADLQQQVHNYHDRGLLALALHPDFPEEPWIYVAYAHDAPIGGTAPLWGYRCPSPFGGGCPASGRIARLRLEGDVAVEEDVLVEDFCQQFPVHSMGDLAFGPDGALYAGAGEGAHAGHIDRGQLGSPPNPCGDPPDEGGSLRSQDLLTPADPVGLSGSIIRIDPETGEAAPGNPNERASDPNARRILAHGFRNPYRFTVRPGTDELWIGDVGKLSYEEIDVVSPGAPRARNHGWPCFEGPMAAFGEVPLCAALHASGGVAPPWLAIERNSPVGPEDACVPGNGSISGIAFAPAEATPYPAEFRGALFFADYGRRCVWSVPRGADGRPDAARARAFARDSGTPVQLLFGPGGELFWMDVAEGALKRIRHTAGNGWPSARLDSSATEGDLPLTVGFHAGRSTDPDGDPLTYEWDLDGDGDTDSTARALLHEYTEVGAYRVRLRVSDPDGATATATTTIAAGGRPPEADIAETPRWSAGEPLVVAGSATDAEDGALPAEALSWRLVLQHCPSGCHEHPVEQWEGASRELEAPAHEYPSHLELRLTATDSTGMTGTATAAVFPRTAQLTLRSEPAGLPLALDGETAAAPFDRTVIRGTRHSVTAPAVAGSLPFREWADGGTRSRDVLVTGDATYTARYRGPEPPPAAAEETVAGPGEPGPLTLPAPVAALAAGNAPLGAAAGAPRRVTLRTLLRRGVRVRVASAVPARATATLAHGGRRVGRQAERGARGGARTLVLRPRAAARRRLRSARRGALLTVRVTLAAADGRRETVSRRVRVARG